jgi:branched-chain amino acid transport system permease protein
VATLTVAARNLLRSPTGLRFMAVRDMETAARVTGVPIFRTKLLAFAISSFYCGVAGVLWAFCYLGTVEPHGLDLTRSFQVLFIVIIGGLGSVAGSFLGAAFIVLLPVLLDHVARGLLSGSLDAGNMENAQKILFGSLILLFLIKEPEGLARLCEVALRLIGERVRPRASMLLPVLNPTTEARRGLFRRWRQS